MTEYRMRIVELQSRRVVYNYYSLVKLYSYSVVSELVEEG